MSKILDALHEVLGTEKIRQHEPLDQHTLVKKGGIAEFYVEIEKVDELIRLVQKARALELPVYVFGSGALVAIPEGEIAGLVIKNLCRRFDKISMKGKISRGERSIEKVFVSAEAGVLMNQLVRFTIEEGLEGLEYQLGLPGTVGGAVYSDAYYKESFVRDHVHSVRIVNKNGEVQMYTEKFPFLLKRKKKFHEQKTVLLSIVFEMTPQNKKLLWERGGEAVAFRNKGV